jgi:hypothetical protein
MFPFLFRRNIMKTFIVIAVFLYGIGTALSAAKDSLDNGKSLLANRHAQIEAVLASN